MQEVPTAQHETLTSIATAQTSPQPLAYATFVRTHDIPTSCQTSLRPIQLSRPALLLTVQVRSSHGCLPGRPLVAEYWFKKGKPIAGLELYLGTSESR